MIEIGNQVRSFDFALTLDDGAQLGRDLEGERACYVEGVVESFIELEGCQRYKIRVDRDVFGGEESDRRVGNMIYPPVNGTPKLLGRVTDYVELV